MAVAVIVIWVILAIVAGIALGNRKGRPGLGFVLALLLGWIGVLILALIPPTQEARVRKAQQRMQVEATARQRMGGQQ